MARRSVALEMASTLGAAGLAVAMIASGCARNTGPTDTVARGQPLRGGSGAALAEEQDDSQPFEPMTFNEEDMEVEEVHPPNPAIILRSGRSHSLSLTEWTPIGPAPIVNGNTPGGQPTTGRIGGIAAHPTDPNIIYVTPVGGGVWKTIDAGTTWTPLTDDEATLFMGAVAVSQSDPNVVYAGTGEATNSILSFYGRGVLKSTDAGATWELMGNSVFNRRTISRVVIHPSDPNIVYVATGGGLNGVSGNRGIWKTTDGGASWNVTSVSITATSFGGNYSDLLMHPTDPQTLFCAVGHAGGSGRNGVYKTVDGGTNWAPAGDHPTASLTNGRISIAISRSNPLVLYSIIHNTSTEGLLKMMKTIDGGTTWTQLAGVPNFMGGQGWYDQCVAVDPGSPDVVYVGGQSGLDAALKSEDGGATWTGITVDVNGNGPHVDHHYMTFDANGKLLDGNDGGIWRLDDPALGSLTWTDINGNLQITQFIGIATHPTNAESAFGGSQDNGTKQFGGALGWTTIRGGDGGAVRIDPVNPLTMYHVFQYPRTQGTFERSDDGGANWAVKQSGINTADPGNFYVSFVLDPSNPSRLLLGTNRIYETTDQAENWVAISAPNANGWGASAAVDCMAIAPSDPETIYACAGPSIYVTLNGGATWALRNSGTSGDFHDIAIDKTDSLTAYVARDRFGGGKVFKTVNGGLNWASISGDLPDVPAQSIVIAQNNPGPADDTLYLGTDTGVYRSTNGGTNWLQYPPGMPNASVFDLELSEALGILAAGTHGRGVFEILLPESPSIEAIADAATACGSPFDSAAPVASGTPPLTWSLLAGPPGATIDSASGVVSWTNPVVSPAAYTVTVKAENDGGGFDTHAWTLTVRFNDSTGDGQVTLADYTDLSGCLGGPGTAATLPCACAFDSDSDFDLDLIDYAGFSAEFGN